MSNMTAEEHEARTKLTIRADTIAKTVRRFSDGVEDLNRHSHLDWRLRTALRDLEGMLDKVEWQCLDVLERVGSEEAMDVIEEIWGPVDDEV